VSDEAIQLLPVRTSGLDFFASLAMTVGEAARSFFLSLRGAIAPKQYRYLKARAIRRRA
jgi:hypothetical protein